MFKWDTISLFLHINKLTAEELAIQARSFWLLMSTMYVCRAFELLVSHRFVQIPESRTWCHNSRGPPWNVSCKKGDLWFHNLEDAILAPSPQAPCGPKWNWSVSSGSDCCSPWPWPPLLWILSQVQSENNQQVSCQSTVYKRNFAFAALHWSMFGLKLMAWKLLDWQR